MVEPLPAGRSPAGPPASGRVIPDPGFAGDDGSVPAAVAVALEAYAADPEGRHAATLSVLQDARLLVPVVALLGEIERGADGLDREKTSDMATVLLRGRDGRTALLAFSGGEAMRRWDPQARPVPVTARVAARAAVQDGADALVVDVAGPTMVVVESEDLRALADGFRLTLLGDRFAWVRPES